MPKCSRFDSCELTDEADPRAGLCILHSPNPVKDKEAFAGVAVPRVTSTLEIFSLTWVYVPGFRFFMLATICSIPTACTRSTLLDWAIVILVHPVPRYISTLEMVMFAAVTEASGREASMRTSTDPLIIVGATVMEPMGVLSAVLVPALTWLVTSTSAIAMQE